MSSNINNIEFDNNSNFYLKKKKKTDENILNAQNAFEYRIKSVIITLQRFRKVVGIRPTKSLFK